MTGDLTGTTEPTWTEVDGVPTVWADAPGPLHARLMFRVGKADENLCRSGITHLAEHLALHRLGQQPHQNGSVRTSITAFDISGDDDTVRVFLNDLCVSLHDLPLERMDAEIRVLEAESARRGTGAFSTALAWRFGPNGPGLWRYDEYADVTVDGAAVQDWAHEVFTRDNAILILSGAPPVGLTLSLPPGSLRPVPPLTDMLGTSPAWFEHEFQDVSGLACLERSSAAAVYVHTLKHELARRLRFDRAIAYSPDVDYDPYDGTTAFVALLADSHPERLAEVGSEVLECVEGLAATGVEPVRLDDFRALLAREQEIPGYAVAAAHRAAFDRLTTGRVPDPWQEELARLDVSEVNRVAVEARGSMLYGLPEGVSFPHERIAPAPAWSTIPPVQGEPYLPVQENGARLVLGVDGLTLQTAEGNTATVRFDDCRAVLAWPDGRRVLIAPDGMSITVEPNLWWGGPSLVKYVDVRTPHVQVRRPPRPTAEIPPEQPWQPPKDNPALRKASFLVGFGALLIILGLARATGSPSNGGVGISVLSVVCGIVSIFVGWRVRRKLHRPG